MRNIAICFLALIVLTASEARADTVTACQDGAKAAIDGTIMKVVSYNDDTFLSIDTPSWDCTPVMIRVKSVGICGMGSSIHAEGALSQPSITSLAEGWVLSTFTEGDGAKYEASFSCK